MAECYVTCGFVAIVIILGTCIDVIKAECILDIRSDLDNRSALFVRKNTAVLDGSAFLLPTMTTSVAGLFNGEELDVVCPGSNNRLTVSGTTRQLNAATVECDSGVNLLFNGQSVPASDIKCTEVPQSTVREVGTCSNGRKRLQIGYETSLDNIIRLIDICFDDTRYITSYVNYTLVDAVENRQNITQNTDFDEVDYYASLPDSPETYYTCSNQQRAIGTLIGSTTVSTYIKCLNNANYLTKTHLAAIFDFVYGAQQRSTLYHVNVVPMWLSIKNGNWINLEEEIRQYASNTSREPSDLIIYSGTFGVTKLQGHDIYLGRDNNDNNVVPVPNWVWKLVYEPSAKEGIVFLVVNNPYAMNFACSCACAQTKWTLGWNRQDRNKGYVYCCTVPDFRRAFTGLPDFEVTGLLKKNRPYTPLFPEVPAQ